MTSAGSYGAVPGHYDEMTLGSGELRTPWRRLMAHLDALGPGGLGERWEAGQRLIRENGVTYNVYGDPRGASRPWELDPIPMLLSADEWAGIEAAVAQRATLLDRVLADLYGPQRLLRDRRLPAELVFAHPGFLRACHGVRVPEDRHLHVYAADLARSPDGQWWVMGDRTQAPSGAGYALENRVVLSRILPELFRDFYVRRLAGYFQTYRDTLVRLAPRNRDNPRVVLLTPGPYNETYFEHAYMARYLGFVLAEGGDLTVRDEKVFLKTLSGLLPVDVVLRRQDDAFCDPLELFGGSALGVPGLVQAARAGNVAVANALGSGLVESAATMAFLPGLCRHLLGETLRMPSVATWWCGQEREREYVAANLERLVVKPTFRAPGEEAVFGQDLPAQGRDALLARVHADPHRFVAQERVALSTVPSGSAEAPDPRHLVLRVYAVATEDGYQVMPGGLTRVSASVDTLVVSGQHGGGSKDTWVLSDAPVPYQSLMDRVSRPVDVSRGSFALTSRAADDLFWLGRTAERVEAGVRRFRCALRRVAEEPLRAADAPLPDAVRLLERMGLLPAADSGATATVDERILRAAFDPDAPYSVARSVGSLHRLVWNLRDRISPDAWRVLSGLEQEFVAPALHPALRVSGTLELLDRMLVGLAAFGGLVMEGMTRGLGWTFLEVGRRLERGLQMVELLRHGLVEPAEPESDRLENVLEVGDSRMTYRSRYLTSLQLPLVVDLLLMDEANPRAVAFQLVRLLDRFGALAHAPRDEVEALLARVRSAQLDALVALETAPGASPRRAALDALLTEVGAGLPAVADALNHAYLAHAVPRRQEPGPWSPQ